MLAAASTFRLFYIMDCRRREPYWDKYQASVVCKVMSIDHTFKIVKVVATIDGQPVYGAYWAALNEHGQVRMSIFVYTTAHEELATTLKRYRKAVEELGMPPPQVAATLECKQINLAPALTHRTGLAGIVVLYSDNPAVDSRFFIANLVWDQSALDAPVEIESLPHYTLPEGTKV